MRRVLVTGGGGFVGGHVVRELLDAGHAVTVLDNALPTPETRFLLRDAASLPTIHRGTVEDWTSLCRLVDAHGVERIVSVAALQDFEYSKQHPWHTYQVNVGGLLNVLETARAKALERVVYISSQAAYAAADGAPMSERHPISSTATGSPSGHYGASKAACEVIGLTYFSENDVDFVALRPSSVYGLGMRLPFHVQPMVEGTLAGRPVAIETGRRMRRDYIYARDVARAVRLALEVEKGALDQRVFNVATGTVHSGGDVADAVRTVLPEAQIEIGDAMSDWERQTISTRGELDVSAAARCLGFEPAYGLLEGIADYVAERRAFTAWTTDGVAAAHPG